MRFGMVAISLMPPPFTTFRVPPTLRVLSREPGAIAILRSIPAASAAPIPSDTNVLALEKSLAVTGPNTPYDVHCPRCADEIERRRPNIEATDGGGGNGSRVKIRPQIALRAERCRTHSSVVVEAKLERFATEQHSP